MRGRRCDTRFAKPSKLSLRCYGFIFSLASTAGPLPASTSRCNRRLVLLGVNTTPQCFTWHIPPPRYHSVDFILPVFVLTSLSSQCAHRIRSTKVFSFVLTINNNIIDTADKINPVLLWITVHRYCN